MSRPVLFIHGGGPGAYAADRLLADSLQSALGTSHDVHCPRMPDEENCPWLAWKDEIDKQIAAMAGPVTLVGHSVGGSVLLKYLCDRSSPPGVCGLFVVAAPFWGADRFWHWDELALPADAATRLAGDWPLVFYHSHDDATVPFAHLELYAARLPRATIRVFDGRGHQFNDDLVDIATDIGRT